MGELPGESSFAYLKGGFIICYYLAGGTTSSPYSTSHQHKKGVILELSGILVLPLCIAFHSSSD